MDDERRGGIDLDGLGEYIRAQRKAAQISLRQLARLAGVSNPYLSQIERGLRQPSAEILQQIAKGLRVSSEALYVQAGILDERPPASAALDAIHADTGLTDRQKNVLIEIYTSFRRENERDDQSDASSGDRSVDRSMDRSGDAELIGPGKGKKASNTKGKRK